MESRQSLCGFIKMSEVQKLRVFMKQRLTAAAEEIFELFERTIAEYEEELCRQRKLLDAGTEPQVQLHRTDVQQLLESEEEDPPEQQERSSSLDHQDPPELPHIKEEQEELWTHQEGEQLPGLEEDDIKFTSTPVPVKSEEEDEEDPQSSQLHQIKPEEIRDAEYLKTEYDGEDCGGPEPAWNLNTGCDLQPADDDMTSHSSEPETDDSFDWEDTRKHHPGLNPLQHNEPIRDVDCKLWTRQEGEQLPGLEEADIKFTFGAERTVNTAHIRVNRQFLTECFRKKRSCESVKMSKVQTLRVFMKQRLTAAAEEIFELFERTIAEYEEELCRQRKLLDAGTEPQVQLHRTDVQRSVSKDEVPPEQQECSSSLDQEEPEPPHIKEEQEELWTNQEEADLTRFTFTPVPVKSDDDDEEKPLSSQLHQRQSEQMETEAGGEDCGGPDSDQRLHPETEDKTEDSSEPETDVSDGDWEETRKPQSDLNCQINNEVTVSVGCSSDKEDCGKRCGQKSKLMIHTRIHVREKPFPCSECGKRFKFKRNLTRHMVVHSGEKPFSCSDCGKRFKLKERLTQHMVVHPGERPFSCSDCGKRFKLKERLTQHMVVHSGERPFSCSECGLRFKQKRNLRRHMAIHTEERPFSCSECGKRFKAKVNLMRHMTVHTDERPFSCSECGKRFKLKANLTQHMAVHSGERPFSCSECGKRFKVKTNLIHHMAVHSEAKSFGCSECGKRFKVKTNLTQHMAVHSGERPFSCSECGKRFKLKTNLTQHMAVHLEEKPFSCFECGERFIQKRSLTRHMTCHAGGAI